MKSNRSEKYGHYMVGTIALAAFLSLATTVPAFADTNVNTNVSASANVPGHGQWTNNGQHIGQIRNGMMGMHPAVVGTVSAINGTTLTVNARQGFGSTSPTTAFTVNASGATVIKNNGTSTLSSIAVGDMVAVQGTVSGTSVTATAIRDGFIPGPGMMGKGMHGDASSTPETLPITGNGQPIVAGNVTAMSSSTITITNKSNVTYTVDASNAKIVQGPNTITLASLKVGDAVVVQGTINGTSVTASSVIDQTVSASSNNKPHPGIFGSIGAFFMHIFGF